MNKLQFPFDIQDEDPKIVAEVKEKFIGCLTAPGLVRIGPKGYLFPKEYEKEASKIYNLPIRSSDVFVISLPRSGTTVMQELVWLLENNLDYENAGRILLSARFPFLELNSLYSDPPPLDSQWSAIPSPRLIKTHLPLSLLPPELLDTAKAVYLARDPRDVAVSYYHHNRLFKFHGYTGDFKCYWNFFTRDLITYLPILENVKEAWAKRDHPNLLFLFYEELRKDLPSAIRRVASFLGKQLSEDQIDELAAHLHIDTFRKNTAVNKEDFKQSGRVVEGEESFIRKGKVGGWRDYFDEEMTLQAKQWMAHSLRDTDLSFPTSHLKVD